MPSDLESAKIQLWKESIDAASSSAIGFFISLLYTILLVRLLPQTEVGLFFFYLAIVFLCIQVSKGIGVAVRKRVSSTDEIRLRKQYLWASVLVLIPFLLLVSVLLFTTASVLGSYSPIRLSTESVIIVIATILSVSIMQLGRFYLSGTGEPGLAERYRVIIGKGGMLVFLLFIYFYPSAELALALRGLSFLFAGIVMFYYSPYGFIKPTKRIVIEILQFAKWSIPTNLLNDFYHRWDTILLGIMVGAISISHYDTAVRLATISFPLMLGISSASNVKLSGLYESDKPINKTFEKLLTATSLVAYPFILVFFFSGEYILSILYGPEYIAATGMLIGIAIQQVFQGYRFQFEALFNSCDVPHEATKTSALSVCVNIITAPVFVLQFGAIGVIYSTLLAEVIRLFAYEYQAYRHLDKWFIHKSLLLQAGLLVGLGLVLKTVHMIIPLSNKVTLMTSLVSVVIFYILLYLTSQQTQTIITEAKAELFED